MASYLSEDNIFEAYRKSSAYMRSFLDSVDEQERIAKNKPHPKIEKHLPKVTDGTTSSIVRKTPRRVVQQIPTGKIIGEGWLPIVAGYIFQKKIIPNANEQNAFIDKCWRLIRNALSFGAGHSYVPIVMRGDYFGPDLSIPYIKNVRFEAGKLSDLDSNCIFVDAWYQPADIEAIIKKEKQLAKSAKERGDKYESTWDLKVLEEIKDQEEAKKEDEKSSNENKKDDQHKGGIKLVHVFERGVGSTFYTIHPKSEQIARRKKNKDPRGEIPLQTMYYETDGINPLGCGIVEQVGPMQNLLDSDVQMYQFERALNLQPVTMKWGNWNKSQARLVPNALVDMGSDPNNKWEVLRRETSAIEKFPENYGLIKSQILTLASAPDASISSSVGNPQFSKTDSGVDMQQANVSVDDNYVRKQFESWFERWAETAINLYFAEKSGTEELQLDKDTANKLRQLEEKGELEQGFVSEDNKILIDYDSATEALKFEVDASTSNMKSDQQQLEALDGLISRLQASAILQQAIPPKKIIGAWNAIVAASGVENPEDLSVSDEELAEMEQAQQEAQMQEQQMMQEQAMQASEQEMGMSQFADMEGMQPPEAPIEGQTQQPDLDAQEAELTAQLQQLDEEEANLPPEEILDEDEQAFAYALQDMGYSESQIMQAFAMLESGRSEEEVMEMLESTRSEDA